MTENSADQGSSVRTRALGVSERRAIAEGSRVRSAEIEAWVDTASLSHYASLGVWNAAALVLSVPLLLVVLWPHGRHVALLLWGAAVVLCALAHGAWLRSLARELTGAGSLPRARRVNASLWLAAAFLGVGTAIFLEGAGLRDAVIGIAVLGGLNALVLALLAPVASPFIGLGVLSLGPPGAWLIAQGLHLGDDTLASLGAGTLGLLGIALLGHGLLYRQFQILMERRAELAIQSDRLWHLNRDLHAHTTTLETESRTDALTGLGNRRLLEETLEREWSRCRRERQPLACVLLDIDHFKLFNDRYGHDGGDECLRQVGEVLRDGLRRAGDHAARHGGEEFMVLLPNTDAEGALRVAGQIREAIVSRGIPHEDSPIAGHVTVSLGVASVIPDDGTLVQELPKAADLALYEAKRLGRDRCVLADEAMMASARMAARGLIG